MPVSGPSSRSSTQGRFSRPASRDVEGALGDLPCGRDARGRQEEPGMTGQARADASDDVATGQVLGPILLTIRCENGLRPGARWPGLRGECECLRNLGGCASHDMNAAGLKNAANAGPVRRAGRFQAPRRNSASPRALEGPRRGDPAPDGAAKGANLPAVDACHEIADGSVHLCRLPWNREVDPGRRIARPGSASFTPGRSRSAWSRGQGCRARSPCRPFRRR